MKLNTIFSYYFFISLVFIFTCNAKVLIITHAYDRPDFIQIQHDTFKKFLQDDYEFVIFNDAHNLKKRQQINVIAKKLNLGCIEIPQAIHDKPYLYRMPHENYNHSCCRCANVVQYSLDILGFKHDGIVVIIDSDMFLIKKFSVTDYMKNFDLVGCPQSRGRINYLWNGLVFLNMKTLPDKETINFNCGHVEGAHCDVGGYTYYYLQKHQGLRVNFYSHACFNSLPSTKDALLASGYTNAQADLILQNRNDQYSMEYHLDKTFLHYRGGGNWMGKDHNYHDEKTRIMKRFLEQL